VYGIRCSSLVMQEPASRRFVDDCFSACCRTIMTVVGSTKKFVIFHGMLTEHDFCNRKADP